MSNKLEELRSRLANLREEQRALFAEIKQLPIEQQSQIEFEDAAAANEALSEIASHSHFRSIHYLLADVLGFSLQYDRSKLAYFLADFLLASDVQDSFGAAGERWLTTYAVIDTALRVSEDSTSAADLRRVELLFHPQKDSVPDILADGPESCEVAALDSRMALFRQEFANDPNWSERIAEIYGKFGPGMEVELSEPLGGISSGR